MPKASTWIGLADGNARGTSPKVLLSPGDVLDHPLETRRP